MSGDSDVPARHVGIMNWTGPVKATSGSVHAVVRFRPMGETACSRCSPCST